MSMNMLKCEKCKIKFKNSGLYRNHVRWFHKKQKQIFCEKCDRNFRDISFYKHHIKFCKGKNEIIELKENSSVLCEYGCGLFANFVLKNKKHCCSKSQNSCKAIKEKNSKATKNTYMTNERNEKTDNCPNRGKSFEEYFGEKRAKEIKTKIQNALFNVIKQSPNWGRGKTIERENERRRKLSLHSGGPRPGGGRCKVYEYISPIAGKMKLNSEEIKVAQILDQLKFIWKRNFKGFKYTSLEGKNRKFYPDFYIKDFDVYLEYKGWVTDSMIHKMADAKRKNEFNFLIIYGMNKRYRNMGLNLEQILNDSNLLTLNLEFMAK